MQRHWSQAVAGSPLGPAAVSMCLARPADHILHTAVVARQLTVADNDTDAWTLGGCTAAAGTCVGHSSAIERRRFERKDLQHIRPSMHMDLSGHSWHLSVPLPGYILHRIQMRTGNSGHNSEGYIAGLEFAVPAMHSRQGCMNIAAGQDK